MFPWGRPELRTGARGAIFPGLLACGAPSSAPRALPSPGARARPGCRVHGDARICAGMCEDARRCRRGPGPLGGRVTEQAKPGAGTSLPPALGVPAPLPQPRTPPCARRPPAGAGGGVPKHPALSPPSPLCCLLRRRRFSTAASWAPPRVGGNRGPASAPFPFQARQPPHAGALGFPRRTDCPADRRTHAPALEAGIPLVGGGPGSAPGRGGGGGGEGGRGGDRPGPEAPLALTRESPGRPKSSARPIWDPGRSPDPMQEARLGVRCLWVACLNRSRLHIPAAQSQGLEPNRCSINA